MPARRLILISKNEKLYSSLLRYNEIAKRLFLDRERFPSQRTFVDMLRRMRWNQSASGASVWHEFSTMQADHCQLLRVSRHDSSKPSIQGYCPGSRTFDPTEFLPQPTERDETVTELIVHDSMEGEDFIFKLTQHDFPQWPSWMVHSFCAGLHPDSRMSCESKIQAHLQQLVTRGHLTYCLHSRTFNLTEPSHER